MAELSLELSDLPPAVQDAVERAIAGDEVTITRAGRPAVTLSPIPGAERPPRRPIVFGLGLGTITMHPSFWDEEDMADWLGGPENPV
jgi:antitoxin (DNA-binding transcriptional repressor) of toxin-antitoxin stability system